MDTSIIKALVSYRKLDQTLLYIVSPVLPSTTSGVHQSWGEVLIQPSDTFVNLDKNFNHFLICKIDMIIVWTS